MVNLLLVAFTLGAALSDFGYAGREAQESQKVFAQVSESVFLVEMVNAEGATLATGTAFLVGPKTLLTNAHVVSEGLCRLRVGPARIKCSVSKSDSLHDLAELVLETELVAPVLQLDASAMSPGLTVYVISNPLGMERTISQGLLSSPRTVEGRELIQLSAAVSPGSSGGPVVGSAGNVIGIIVSSRKDGQLLNFAIPAKTAKAFLDGTLQLDSFASVTARIGEVQAALESLEYSTDPATPYGRKQAEITALVRRASSMASISSEHMKVADLARWRDPEVAIEAARKASGAPKPDLASLLLLSELLVTRGEATTTAVAEKARVLGEAEAVSQKAITVFGPSEETYYGLSEVQRARGQTQFALSTLTRATALEKGLSDRVVESLARLNATAKNLVESEKWLDRMIQMDSVSAFDYWLLGDFLKTAGAPKLSAKASDRGAAISKGAFSVGLWTDAAEQWLNLGADDEALGSARAAIETGKGLKNVDSKLSYAHRVVSIVLLSRGLLDVALTEARQAVDLDRDSALAYWTFAEALEKNDRKLEAIDAFKSALRLSDGKYADMHFELGSVYFKLERWTDAQASYEIAARLDQTSYAAAYNVGMCLYNLGKKRDALPWLEETLRRSPSASTKAKAEQFIREIR